MMDSIDGLTFEQAMELHRLHRECILNCSQIAKLTGISPSMVLGVLTGKYFPGALEAWEKKESTI